MEREFAPIRSTINIDALTLLRRVHQINHCPAITAPRHVPTVWKVMQISNISDSRISRNDASRNGASYDALIYDALTLERCYHPPATSKGFEGIHASPITGLPHRDLIVLQDWFDREDIDEITANVGDRLSQLCPEPCWDEHSYDFLGNLLKQAG